MLAILLAWLSWHLWGRLKACEAIQASKSTIVAASQQQEGHIEAKSTGKLTAKPGPSRPCPTAGECPPCPEFTLEFGSEATAKGSQAQSITVTPARASDRYLALWGGGSYLSTGEGIGTASLQYNGFVLDGGVGLSGNWQVGAKARFFEWK